MGKDIERLRYFDGLILKEAEFNLEQEYHIRMRRLHNSQMHGWGIVKGLTLEHSGQNHLVTITEGLAIDLVTNGEFGEDHGRELLIPGNISVDVSGYNVDDDVYVWIYHVEEPYYIAADRGGDEPIHWKESVGVGHGLEKPEDLQVNILLGRLHFVADSETGGPALNADEIKDKDVDGQDLRTYAGGKQVNVDTEKLTLSDNSITTGYPYLDANHFTLPDNSTVDGIDVASNYTHFTGDVQISGDLMLFNDTRVNRILEDISTPSSDDATAIPTVDGVRNYVDGLSGDSNDRITELVNRLSPDPDGDSIAERTSTGALRAIAAESDNEVITLGQLRAKGYDGNLADRNVVATDLNDAVETGFYFCSISALNLPEASPSIFEKGVLTALKETDGVVHQEFISTQSPKRYSRILTGVTWTPWTETMTRENMDAHFSGTDHDAHYYNLLGSTLQGTMDAGQYLITNLPPPVGDDDAARWIDVKDVSDALANHQISADHDSRYMQAGSYDGDLDQLQTRGVVDVTTTSTNTPQSGLAGSLYMSMSQDGLALSQIFVSFTDNRIWLRYGDVSISDGTITYQSWMQMVTQEILDNHKASGDHDGRYYQNNLAIDLANNMNAAGYVINSLGAPVVSDDAARKAEVDAVSTALDTHKTSTDHDALYAVQRTYLGDLDGLNMKGVIAIDPASTNLPAGAGDGLVYMSGSADGTLLSQLFVSLTDHRVWSRTSNSGTWTAWTLHWNNSGVESDLSAPDTTGCKVKYPDGRMEQFGRVEASGVSFPYQITFPEAFLALTQVEITSLDGSLTYTSRPSSWTTTGFDITAGMVHSSTPDYHAGATEIAITWRAVGTHSV